MRNSEYTRSVQRLEHMTAVAQRAGVKLTHQRLEIFRELTATDEHLDAESLFRAVQQRMPTVSLDTVYRTLWMLHDLGLVATLGPKRDRIRFDANLDPHHHYICVRCGLVLDFESQELNSLHLPGLVKDLGGVLDARVEVRGVCARCEQGSRRRRQPKHSQNPRGGAHHRRPKQVGHRPRNPREQLGRLQRTKEITHVR
jgi:Fur family transcriptional regulator, peroxide stress response regulator